MFEIYDGRLELYQWDIDRKLIVKDENITQVHFCNRSDDCSLVCEIYNENGVYLVDIPNVLLQEAWAIRVFGYDKNFTKFEKVFRVNARTKPTDYVYTETEILCFSSFEKRVTEIEEKGVSQEAVEKGVTEYLTNNPIVHPVESVNGKTGAVELTAADVGALPDTTEIPTIEGLASEEYVNTQISNYEVDFTGIATEKFVTDAISDYEPDLSNHYTKSETDNKITNELDGYALKSYVDETFNNIVIPEVDLADYATMQYVEDAIDDIVFPETDLTGYATEKYVDNAIANYEVDLTGYTTKEYVNYGLDTKADKTHTHSEYLTKHQDLSAYALKSEVPSVKGLASELYVDAEVKAINDSLGKYATKEFVDVSIANIPEPDLTGFATKKYVEDMMSLIDTGDGSGNVNINLSEYAKTADVNAALADKANKVHTHDEYLTEHQSLEGYATQDYVNNAVAGKADEEHTHDEYLTEHQDLSDYALKSEIPSVDGLATTKYVDDAIENVDIPEVDLSEYAKKTDIPNVSGFITEIPAEYVTENELAAKGYATRAYVDNAVANNTGGSGGLSEDEVNTLINNALAEIGVAEDGEY